MQNKRVNGACCWLPKCERRWVGCLVDVDGLFRVISIKQVIKGADQEASGVSVFFCIDKYRPFNHNPLCQVVHSSHVFLWDPFCPIVHESICASI
jgi:hypothetical protein